LLEIEIDLFSDTMSVAEVRELFPDRERRLTVESSLLVINALDKQIVTNEKQLKNQTKPEASFELLQSVYGLEPILALTIWLKTVDIGRLRLLLPVCCQHPVEQPEEERGE
jgi:hypothetical protein